MRHQHCPNCKDNDPKILMWTKRTIFFGCYECQHGFEVVRSADNNHLVAEFEKPKQAIRAEDFMRTVG